MYPFSVYAGKCHREEKIRQGAASLVHRVAIVRPKGYCDSVDFLRFIPGLSSSWRSNTSKKNPRACTVCVDLKEDHMSRKNGDRARFDRQRNTKIHNRARIRELWKTIRAQETSSAQNVARPGKTLGSPEAGPIKKSTITSSDPGA